MISANLTFHGCHLKTGETRSHFEIQVLHKQDMLLTQDILGILNMSFVFFYDIQNSKKLQVKNMTNFSLSSTIKLPKYGPFCNLVCVVHTQFPDIFSIFGFSKLWILQPGFLKEKTICSIFSTKAKQNLKIREDSLVETFIIRVWRLFANRFNSRSF